MEQGEKVGQSPDWPSTAWRSAPTNSRVFGWADRHLSCFRQGRALSRATEEEDMEDMEGPGDKGLGRTAQAYGSAGAPEKTHEATEGSAEVRD